MRHDALRLSPRQKRWFYGAFLGLDLTGTVWLVVQRWAAATDPESPAAALPSWLMKAHGALAMLALVVIGTLLPLHVRRGWRAHRNRGSGALMLGVIGGLILTGYGLYYAGGDTLRTAIAWGHDTVGVLLPAFVGWHIWRGRRASRPGRGP